MNTRRVFRFIAPMLAVLLLAACGGTGSTTSNPATSAAASSGGNSAAASASGGSSSNSASASASGNTAASASGSTGQSGSGQQVTLTWAFWGSPEEVATHQKVAQAFMQQHPNIQIKTYNQPWADYFTKLQTLWASGDKSAIPDVMFMFPVPRYAANGVLENLDPYIKKNNYNLDDYWPALLESAKYNGSVYGLPRDMSAEVLYYNKDLFDQAGVGYPTDKWTWTDLQNAAQKLAQSNGGRVSRYGLGMEGGKYQLWIGQNKGSILDDMRNPGKCTLADKPAMDGIKFFADMMNNNLALRDANLTQAGGDAAVFQSQQAAMIIQNASRVPVFNEAGLKYDVAPVPIPQGGQRSAASGGAAWTMSSSSQHKEEAWTFMQWLQSTDGGQRLYTETGEILPALRSTARSDAFLKPNTPPANRQAFLTEADNAKVGRLGYFGEWGELEDSLITPGLQRIWAGEAKPEQQLPQICQQVDTFLKQKGYPKK